MTLRVKPLFDGETKIGHCFDVFVFLVGQADHEVEP